MNEFTFSSLLIWILDVAFAGAGLANLIGPKKLREAYARRRFPGRYRYIAGVTGVVAAILLAGPSYRVAGLTLAAVALFFAVANLLARKEYPGALLGMALLAAVWLRFLIGPI